MPNNDKLQNLKVKYSITKSGKRKVGGSNITAAKKQLRISAVKECDAANPAWHMLHVPPPKKKNVNVHKAMFLVPSFSRLADKCQKC